MSLEQALSGIKFDDGMGKLESLPLVGYADLEGPRRAVYEESGCLSNCSPDIKVISAKYTSSDGAVVEHVVKWDGSTATPVLCECGISYEEVPPTAMVEYQYDEGGPWRLARISLEPMMAYKAHKFKLWREMLDKPSCEAAFARMLKAGPLNRLYDKLGFPMPADEEEAWKIVDEKSGKTVDIPRPVHALRVWDPNTDSYTDVSPIMDGAPADEEGMRTYWDTTMQELRAKHGNDYIDAMLAR